MKNFHILQISFVPMTNQCLYNRVRIKSQLFKQSVIIPWDNEPGETSTSFQQAKKWLESKGFDIVGNAEGNSDYDYIITNTFEPLKPIKS